MQDVYVVKHSIATSLGNSVEAAWQRLLKGHSGLDAICRFQADRLSSQKACCIPDLLPAAEENRV
jgi:3-oxoacyl-(acyl-carrier-protein) synthase